MFTRKSIVIDSAMMEGRVCGFTFQRGREIYTGDEEHKVANHKGNWIVPNI